MWRLVSENGDTRDVSTYVDAMSVATTVHDEQRIGSEVWLVKNGCETLVTWVPFTTSA